MLCIRSKPEFNLLMKCFFITHMDAASIYYYQYNNILYTKLADNNQYFFHALKMVSRTKYVTNRIKRYTTRKRGVYCTFLLLQNFPSQQLCIHKCFISYVIINGSYISLKHVGMSHLYFSESTAANADRYLSIAACAAGVKSSPM